MRCASYLTSMTSAKVTVVCLCVLFTCARCFVGEYAIQELSIGPLEGQLKTMNDLALSDINNSTEILPDIILSINQKLHRGSAATAIAKIIEYSNDDQTFVIGNPISSVSAQSGIAASVFGIAQLSAFATTPKVSNNLQYPYYSRLTTSSSNQAFATIAAIEYYSQFGLGWNDVALLSSADEYGNGLAFSFIDHLHTSEITIQTFQQILIEQEDLSHDLGEIVHSNARVIVAFVFFTTWERVITQANETGLVGDNYVWFVPHSVVGTSILYSEDVSELTRGIIGTFDHVPTSGPVLDPFLERWNALDPAVYPGAGEELSLFALLVYDIIQTSARAIDIVNKMGLLDVNERIPAEVWTEAVRSLRFVGLTGDIIFLENGDRVTSFDIQFYVPELRKWTTAGTWSPIVGYEQTTPVIWSTNTTDIPDLDIREPFDYWSCHDKEKGTDKTGKSVTLHSPDRSDIDDIDYDYYCDSFIDCKNLSDEAFGCETNYVILFIVFGVVTFSLLSLCFVLFIFVVIFGIILKYKRVRVSSPEFLILMLLSVVIGYLSIFAWYGKPHPVACGFQPWLLGLSTISMIGVLSVRNFRIWRIFKFPYRKTKITNLELMILWIVVMIPAVIILVLWTIISTPTAKLEFIDGNDHNVCTTGGFTGSPGGYIFVSIFIFYGAVLLFVGIVLTVATRNVPSIFNETKLLSLSIYNIAFLSVVVIPVFLVIQAYNPFIAWIIRSIAILYAFTSTLFAQFAPLVLGVIFLDKFKDSPVEINFSTQSSKERLQTMSPRSASYSS